MVKKSFSKISVILMRFTLRTFGFASAIDLYLGKKILKNIKSLSKHDFFVSNPKFLGLNPGENTENVYRRKDFESRSFSTFGPWHLLSSLRFGEQYLLLITSY